MGEREPVSDRKTGRHEEMTALCNARCVIRNQLHLGKARWGRSTLSRMVTVCLCA